jgi:D-amino-acid dehydrogenase
MLTDPIGPLVIRWSYLLQISPWLCRFILASRAAEVSRISQALASILSMASGAWRDIVHGTGAETRLVTNGWMRVYSRARSFRVALADAERQRALGVQVDILNADEIRQLEPALAPAFVGATFCPEVSNVNSPVEVMRALAALIRQQGGTFRKIAVSRIRRSPRPEVVDVEGGSRAFDRIVIAAGAWSRRLIRTVGIDLPLDTERGYHVMLPMPSQPLRRPVSVASPGYTLVPMENGIRLTSGVEFAGLDAAPDFRRIRSMTAHAATVLSGLKTPPLSEWLGFRPSMPHSLPVIASVRSQPNIVLAFGHGHLGLTLGPITGRLVATIIQREEPPLDLRPFDPTH